MKYRIGVMGCGTIFPAYMEGIARFAHLEVVRCADIIPERALAGHERFGIPRYGGPNELLADPEVDIVLNITPPNTHYEVSRGALAAGKHVYSEKPITTRLADADALVEQAAQAGLTFGAAPDTFLGTWGATSRTVVDSGELGHIAAAVAFVPHNRVETWHPDPTFLFQPGGGPTLDIGPYYVTALVNMLGPVAEVVGMTRVGQEFREVTSRNRLVDQVAVEIPTHSTALLRFRSGVLVTLILSSDIWATGLPFIEVYGDRATLSLPHPNWFDGDVRIKGVEDSANWSIVPPVTPPGSLRGEGIADMVASFDGRPQRTGAKLARHVLEVLLAIQAANDARCVVKITSSCERPTWPAPATLRKLSA